MSHTQVNSGGQNKRITSLRQGQTTLLDSELNKIIQFGQFDSKPNKIKLTKKNRRLTFGEKLLFKSFYTPKLKFIFTVTNRASFQRTSYALFKLKKLWFIYEWAHACVPVEDRGQHGIYFTQACIVVKLAMIQH